MSVNRSPLEASIWDNNNVNPARAPLDREEPIRLGVLTNPRSGRNKKRGLRALQRFLTRHNQVTHAEVQTPAEINSALKAFAAHHVNLVVINGGDGTVQAVLTALFREQVYPFMPLLAVLPAGTTSMIAGDVGFSDARLNTLGELASGRYRPARIERAIERRHVLAVRISPQHEPIYGMFLGAACIWRGIEFCRRHIHTRGVRGELGAGLALVGFIGTLLRGRQDYCRPASCILRFDGQPPEYRTLLILLVSSLERLLMGIRPYAPAGSGALYYTGVEASPKHPLRVLPSLLRAYHHPLASPENGYCLRKVNTLEIVMDGGLTLDGELFETDAQSGPVRIWDGGTVDFVYL